MTIEEIVNRISLDSEKGCWIWHGAFYGTNYGAVYIRGKNRLVHRLIYECFKGRIAEDLDLDHTCRIRSCCNPNHLEAVTHQENVKRAIKKTHCIRGHCYEKDGVYIDVYGRHCKKCKGEIKKRKRKI